MSSGENPQAGECSPAKVYPFYKANIHERRLAAYVCRFLPLLFVATVVLVIVWSIVHDSFVLVLLSAAFNTFMWVWLVPLCILCILGSMAGRTRVKLAAAVQGKAPTSGAAYHVLLLPNYKEDEAMMEQTLQSLAEAQGASAFRVVLAMEQREGPEAERKGRRLQEQFAGKFEWVHVSMHPGDLQEDHLDGSSDLEVPGKASNLKWALKEGLARCKAESLKLSMVLLTIADADCLFHPSYFGTVGEEFGGLRKGLPDSARTYTMWQAPQMPFRNYFDSPCCSRCWGYVASVFEFGGVFGLSLGTHHMSFSAYTMPLQLAQDVQPWDGDVIAEDHHCFLKSFFYVASLAADLPTECTLPALELRPVLLPVKSTSVANPDGYWRSYVERWQQAKRHSQGMAEYSYALLAAWDAVCSLPMRAWSCRLVFRILRALLHMWCIHLLPFCQSACLGIFTYYWAVHREHVPGCPTEYWLMNWDKHFLVCGLAGSYVLVLPIVIPYALIYVANWSMMSNFFLKPGNEPKPRSLWHREDGATRGWASRGWLAMSVILFVDLVLLFPILMIPYGLGANICGFVNVALFGNRFNYVTASKGVSSAPSRGASAGKGVKYGSTDSTISGSPSADP